MFCSCVQTTNILLVWNDLISVCCDFIPLQSRCITCALYLSETFSAVRFQFHGGLRFIIWIGHLEASFWYHDICSLLREWIGGTFEFYTRTDWPSFRCEILSPHPPTRWAQSHHPGIVATPGYHNATGMHFFTWEPCTIRSPWLMLFASGELVDWFSVVVQTYIPRMVQLYHYYRTQPSVRAPPTANMAGSSNFKTKMKTVRMVFFVRFRDEWFAFHWFELFIL